MFVNLELTLSRRKGRGGLSFARLLRGRSPPNKNANIAIIWGHGGPGAAGRGPVRAMPAGPMLVSGRTDVRQNPRLETAISQVGRFPLLSHSTRLRRKRGVIDDKNSGPGIYTENVVEMPRPRTLAFAAWLRHQLRD